MADAGERATGDDGSLTRFLERADAILRGEAAEESGAVGQGVSIGGCRLIRRLGEGGMGVVWLAEDERLQRQVAVKLLAPHMTLDEEAIWRFGQEATAAARLTHPGIVALHSAGEDEGVRYLVMDRVDGIGLDRFLARFSGRKPENIEPGEAPAVVAHELGADATGTEAPEQSYVQRVTGWMVQVAEALHHAHSRGVLHRDIKPSNLLVDASGRVRIVDFGLARVEEAAAVTRTGAILGTVTYTAPECLSGRPDLIDARADVYGVGAVLFELLTFRAPFISGSLTELIEQVNRSEPPSPQRLCPNLPRDLALIVLKCLAKERRHRYATAQDLAEDLQRFLDGKTVLARPAGPFRKLRYWARRHPVKATGLAAVALVAAAALPATRIAAEWRAAREADNERRIASQRIEEFKAALVELERAREHYKKERSIQTRRYDDVERGARLVELELGLREIETKRARLLEEARSALERAARVEQRYGGVSHATDDAFAEYYLFRYELTLGQSDPIQTVLLREAVLRHDRTGEFANRLEGETSLSITTEPSDAEVFLFRYEGYETLAPGQVVPRLVPVPTRGRRRCRPAAWVRGFCPGSPCLVVIGVDPDSPASAAGIAPGDLVLTIENSPCGDGVFVTRVRPGSAAAAEGVKPWHRVREADGVKLRGLLEWKHVPVESSGSMRWVIVGAKRFFVASDKPIQEALGVEVTGPGEVLKSPAGAGGGSLVVLRRGERFTLHVPAGRTPGLSCETTAYPLILAEENRVSAGEQDVSPGSYLIYAMRPGFESQRYPIVAPRGGSAHASIELLPADSTPAGHVWIPEGVCRVGGDPDQALDFAPEEPEDRNIAGFFIRRTEVTLREWFEFVNTPETLRQIEQARREGRTIYLPRHYNHPRPLATLGPDGRWLPQYHPDAPVLGISGKDVADFLKWHNARARERGAKWLWKLPSHLQWQKAARGADGRLYPWGNRFDPDLCLCMASRHRLIPEIASRFEPRDESPFGVADTAGSRREWIEHGHIVGGSWGDGDRRFFRASYVDGLGEGYYNWTCGFRPVLTRNRESN